MSFLSEPISIFPIRPNRTLGGISGYLTVDENGTDKLTITRQPVQQGATITDHAYKEPVELAMKIIANDNEKPLSEIYQDIIDLQNSRVPFSVVTGKRTYGNMLLATVSQTTDKYTENVLALNLVLQEIIVVQVTSTIVPPRSRQRNPGTTGATQKGGKKSALKIGVEAASKLFGG